MFRHSRTQTSDTQAITGKSPAWGQDLLKPSEGKSHKADSLDLFGCFFENLCEPILHAKLSLHS
jgi:hypothetical protein